VRMPLFRKKKRWVTIISAILLSSLLLAACGENSPSILNPAGPVAASEATLFYLILGVATFIFIVVEAALIYSIFRFRERPNSPAPRQIHGNNAIELAWTIAPSIFLFIVLGATIYTMFTLYPSGEPQLQVRVVAHQWWWEFDYINYPGSNGQSVVTADTMHIPAGTIINAELYSNNVIHSFWVPALSGKLDVIPGHDNHLLFEAYANTVGHTYPGECVEFCGSQHAHMHFDVTVDTSDGFNTWISQQQQAAVAQNFNGLTCNPGGPIPQSDLVACGAKFFAQGACVGCHGIVGVNLNSYTDPKAALLIGPNLTHFGSRDLIAGGVLPNTPANLAIWLASPQTVKPGSDMPNLGLSPEQINALVAYLESLK
jgi:cytochrome c oxidase subunit II